MRPTTMVLRASVATMALTACGPRPADDQPPAEAAIAAPTPSMAIVTPQDGDTIPGPAVMARLSARDFVVVPAGDTTPNSGHFHLFLDRDVSKAGEPIPAEPGQIIHLGTGADSLKPRGRHAGCAPPDRGRRRRSSRSSTTLDRGYCAVLRAVGRSCENSGVALSSPRDPPSAVI